MQGHVLRDCQLESAVSLLGALGDLPDWAIDSLHDYCTISSVVGSQSTKAEQSDDASC